MTKLTTKGILPIVFLLFGFLNVLNANNDDPKTYSLSIKKLTTRFQNVLIEKIPSLQLADFEQVNQGGACQIEIKFTEGLLSKQLETRRTKDRKAYYFVHFWSPKYTLNVTDADGNSVFQQNYGGDDSMIVWGREKGYTSNSELYAAWKEVRRKTWRKLEKEYINFDQMNQDLNAFFASQSSSKYQNVAPAIVKGPTKTTQPPVFEEKKAVVKEEPKISAPVVRKEPKPTPKPQPIVEVEQEIVKTPRVEVHEEESIKEPVVETRNIEEVEDETGVEEVKIEEKITKIETPTTEEKQDEKLDNKKNKKGDDDYDWKDISVSKHFNLGARLGLNFHSMEGSDATGSIGTVFGLWSANKINKRLGWQVEFLYVEQGGERSTESIIDNITTEFDINYLAIPIGVSVHPMRFFDIHGGIQPGYVIKKESVTTCLFCPETTNPIDNINNFDVAWYLGTTINLPYGDGNWMITARYRNGLLDIYDVEDATIKNRGFALTASYKVPLSKLLEGK